MNARPMSGIFPIPFGLTVELDNMYGSRWIIDGLTKLGFVFSYSELRKFKQSVLRGLPGQNANFKVTLKRLL